MTHTQSRRHTLLQQGFRVFGVITLLWLMSLPFTTAFADDYWRNGGRDQYRASQVEGWRLGGNLGRGGYEIFRRDRGGWLRVPGRGIEIGGDPRYPWLINAQHEIYRWNGWRWVRMPGSAVAFGGIFPNFWVINIRGERFSWSGRDWRPLGRDYRPAPNPRDYDRGRDYRYGWGRDDRYDRPNDRDNRYDNRRDDRNNSYRRDNRDNDRDTHTQRSDQGGDHGNRFDRNDRRNEPANRLDDHSRVEERRDNRDRRADQGPGDNGRQDNDRRRDNRNNPRNQ